MTKALLACLVWTPLLMAAAPDDLSRQQDAVVRAGRNIATTSCISCHLVSKDQPVQPAPGFDIPSFYAIADKPGITADALIDFMKTARWQNDVLPHTLLPMSRLTDEQKAQVAAYILSLRAPN